MPLQEHRPAHTVLCRAAAAWAEKCGSNRNTDISLMLSVSPALSAVIGAGAVCKNVYNAEKAKGWKIPSSKLQQKLICLPSLSSHALLIVNNNNGVPHLSGGGFRILVSSCSLPIRCCSLASASPARAGGKGVSQSLKTQEVWKHKMFKTIPVVTAQNMSVMLSRLSYNELWDVSLCFTIHISIRTCLCLCNAGRSRRRARRSSAGSGSGSAPPDTCISRDPIC